MLISIVVNKMLYLRKIENYKSKTAVAVCSDNQGMITHDIFLYRDSTFSTKILDEYYFGKYSIKGNIIYFTNFKEIGICSSYKITDSLYLVPIRCTPAYEFLIMHKNSISVHHQSRNLQ